MPRPTKAAAIQNALDAAEWLRFIEDLMAEYRSCPATSYMHPNYRRSCQDCQNMPCAKMLSRGLNDAGHPLPFLDRPTCGAATRSGAPCLQRVVPGKCRCKYHGGLSTGPKTPEGRARIAEAQKKRWAKSRAVSLDRRN
jgi:hypothetical protein